MDSFVQRCRALGSDTNRLFLRINHRNLDNCPTSGGTNVIALSLTSKVSRFERDNKSFPGNLRSPFPHRRNTDNFPFLSWDNSLILIFSSLYVSISLDQMATVSSSTSSSIGY